MRRVQFAEHFRLDLQSQVNWLVSHREPSWIDGLQSGIDEAEQRIAEYPDIGRLLQQHGTQMLRKLILRRLPFVIWYAYDQADADGDVWLLRIFHTRQQQPAPGPSHPLRRRPR